MRTNNPTAGLIEFDKPPLRPTKTYKYDPHLDPTLQWTGKAERTMAMTVLLKGEKRFTEFSAPSDMKGTKVLVLSPSEVYAYLPAFGKVRRVASSASDQGFMGMAFSLDDFPSRYAHGTPTSEGFGPE